MAEKEIAEDAIDKLKGSALFCLSLGSKELFHSNFLYWLGGIYPKEVGMLFAQFISDQSGDCSLGKTPEREKENIDLRFNFKNGAELIIENKVKSIPYEEQLARYAEEQLRTGGPGKKDFLLISLTRPSFVSGDTFRIRDTTWHFLDYAGLSNLLSKLVDKISDHYHREILNDYVRFAAVLDNISGIADIYFEKDVFDFNNSRIVEQLRGIRIADYYLKKKFALIAEELRRRLADPSVKIFSGSVRWEDWNVERRGRNAAIGTIFVNYGMTRAQGLVEMMYVVKKSLCLGVQIQANSYRKFVVGSYSKSVAEKLKKNDLWFNFPARLGSNLPEYPKKTEKEFNCYNGEFYYRYVTIPDTLKISEAIDCMTEDARTISGLVEDGLIDK
jgi:hypothetical protein